MYQLKLSFSQLPKSLNSKLRQHFHKLNKESHMWDFAVRQKLSPDNLPPKPLQKAKVKLTRHNYRFLDFDGLVGSMKPVIDAIVSSGVLLDDSWKVLGAWEVDQKFRPKAQGPLLEVEILEVQN